MEKLEFGFLTENLIEISYTYILLVGRHPELTEKDSTSWKQEFVEWANEFEDMYPDKEYWDEHDYYETIADFATEKILEFGGVECSQE